MKLTTDFAFAGIDIINKNPLAVLLWGVVYQAVTLVATLLIVVVAGPAMSALQSYEQSPPSDPMAVFGQLGALAPIGLVSFVITLVATAIIQCAVYRSQLQPQAKGFAYMQLGGSEVTQIITTILWYLAFFVFYLLFAVAVVLLIVAVGFATGDIAILRGLLIFVIAIAAIVAFLYILSRWSLALIQSYAEKKINVFGSFKLTKGSGWTLLGGYLLLLIVIIFAAAIIWAILFGIGFGLGNDFTTTFTQMAQPDMSSVATLITPMFVVQTVINILLGGVGYALIYGASVSAYQVLSAKGTNAADVF